jgi:hypothetical protein
MANRQIEEQGIHQLIVPDDAPADFGDNVGDGIVERPKLNIGGIMMHMILRGER